jgi:integrase
MSDTIRSTSVLDNDGMLANSLLKEHRAKRPGPKGDKMKAFPRWRNGKSYWYVKKRGQRPYSTNIEVKDGDLAEDIVIAVRLQETAAERGFLSPRSVAIEAVIAHWMDANRPDPGARYSIHKRFNDALFKLSLIALFMKGKTLGDVISALTKQYVGWRVGDVDGRSNLPVCPKTCESLSTVHGDLTLLAKAITGYAKDHGLTWEPNFYIPNKDRGRTAWLTRDQVARMIWAIRGRIWDETIGGWLTEEIVDPVTGVVSTRRQLRPQIDRDTRQAVFRLLMIGLYTGSRHNVMLNLHWKPRADHGYFDLDHGILHRNGHSQNPNRGKPRMSSYVPEILLWWLHRWSAKDAKGGIDRVIHKLNGAGYRGTLLGLWKIVRADAGLGKDIVVHTLRHTCCTWLKHLGVDVQAAADMVGMHPKTLLRTYGQWSIEGSRRAADAMSTRRPPRKPSVKTESRIALNRSRPVDDPPPPKGRNPSLKTRLRQSEAASKAWIERNDPGPWTQH